MNVRHLPSDESCQDTKCTTGDNATFLRCWARGGLAAVDEVANTEQQEGHVEGKEKEEEGNCGAQGADQQQESEDEPALKFTLAKHLALPQQI